MNNYNEKIKEYLYDRLKNLKDSNDEDVNIYFYFVPANFSDYYVLVQSIQSNSLNNKCGGLRDMNFQIVVYTQVVKNNSLEVEKITNNLLTLLSVENTQNIKLISDELRVNVNPQAKMQVYERMLNFNLLIQ